MMHGHTYIKFDFALLVLYLKFTKFSKQWPYSVYTYYDDTTGLLLWRQYLAVAVLQAAQIVRLMTISTGTKSATLLSWQSIVRKNPFPAAAMIPVGPFKLSTHPATGSRNEDNTEKKEQPLLVWFIFMIFHNSVLAVEVTFYKISYEMIKWRRKTKHGYVTLIGE